ncbi:hypothetical protein T439DRAFT_329940 [Meredithblackwellia eburnea MCA 4105]
MRLNKANIHVLVIATVHPLKVLYHAASSPKRINNIVELFCLFFSYWLTIQRYGGWFPNRVQSSSTSFSVFLHFSNPFWLHGWWLLCCLLRLASFVLLAVLLYVATFTLHLICIISIYAFFTTSPEESILEPGQDRGK